MWVLVLWESDTLQMIYNSIFMWKFKTFGVISRMKVGIRAYPYIGFFGVCVCQKPFFGCASNITTFVPLLTNVHWWLDSSIVKPVVVSVEQNCSACVQIFHHRCEEVVLMDKYFAWLTWLGLLVESRCQVYYNKELKWKLSCSAVWFGLNHCFYCYVLGALRLHFLELLLLLIWVVWAWTAVASSCSYQVWDWRECSAVGLVLFIEAC